MAISLGNEVHAMIDWETLGLKPDAMVLSVGVVIFNADNISDQYYANIDCSFLADKFSIDQSTVDWWNKRENHIAKMALNDNARNVKDVASDIVQLFAMHEVQYLWGNGASFDIPILDHVLETCGLQNPIRFYNYRCHRTLKSLYPIVGLIPQPKTKHHALEDAIYQVKQCQRALKIHYGNAKTTI